MQVYTGSVIIAALEQNYSAMHGCFRKKHLPKREHMQELKPYTPYKYLGICEIVVRRHSYFKV